MDIRVQWVPPEGFQVIKTQNEELENLDAAENRDGLLENDLFPRKETELDMLEQEEGLEAQITTAMATSNTRWGLLCHIMQAFGAVYIEWAFSSIL